MRVRVSICAILFSGLLAAEETPAQWIEKANALKAAGDAAGAVQALERAIALGSKAAEVEDELGFLLAATGQNANAVPHFERAIQLNQRYASAHFHLGVAYWLSGDPGRSIPELETAVLLK